MKLLSGFDRSSWGAYCDGIEEELLRSVERLPALELDSILPLSMETQTTVSSYLQCFTKGDARAVVPSLVTFQADRFQAVFQAYQERLKDATAQYGAEGALDSAMPWLPTADQVLADAMEMTRS